MKITGCILLIISTTAVGFYLSAMLKRRMMLFNQLALLTANLSTAIRYSGVEIHTLLLNEQKNLALPFVAEAVKNLENGDTLSDSWSKALDSLPYAYGLSAEDKSIIIQFGAKLGATDIQGQTEHCNYFKGLFQNKADLLREDYATRSRVYRNLGFFSGLAMALVAL